MEPVQEPHLMQSILASVGDGIILYDRDLCYRFWNPAMERLTGLRADQVLGRCAPEVFPYLKEHGIDELLARALAGETVQGPDIPYVVAETGRQGWQAGSYRPHYDAEGRIVGVIGVVHDITARKRAEDELRRAKVEWEETFDTVPDAVAILDAEHRIVRVNRAMATRLGVPAADCAGRKCFDVVHGLPEPPPWCPHVETCRDGKEHTAEVHEPRLRGDFLVTTTPRFNEHGTLVGAVHVARDITGRKRAEEELRQSQTDLKRAQAVAKTGSWRIDVPGETLAWSDETYRIFGIPTGTPLSYQTFLAAVHPDDRDDVDRKWQGALRGEPYDIEHRIVVGGEVKWVRERAELEWDQAGTLLGGFGTVQDITEKQQAEAALRRQAALLDLSPDAIISRDLGGTIRFWSKGAEVLYGWSAAEAVGRTTEELLQTQLPERPEAVFAQLQQTGRWAGDLVHRTRAGRPLTVQSRWLAQRDAEGAIAEILESNVDMTERHRAEKALATSQRLLHSILEQAPDGITVRDAQGSVMFVNGVARRRALRRPEGTPLAMAPEVWGEYLDADGAPVPVDEWPAAQALRGEMATREFQRRTPAGSLFVLNSAAPLRNDAGEIIGAVTITTDISERKGMEDRLRAALAQEERAVADNVTLLREVHHRVKNNLQMLCDLMYLQMEAMEHPEQHQDLQDAYSRVYAIARLHEHLYQAMQSGRVPLAAYLARLVSGYGDFARGVRLEFAAEVGPQVSLDIDRAIHAGLIVNELITNALKHAFPARQDGDVAVRLRLVEDQLELQVRDNGVGFPEALHLTQPKSLGLRTVNILARGLKATVGVENCGGAVFTVRFPLHADPPCEPKGS